MSAMMPWSMTFHDLIPSLSLPGSPERVWATTPLLLQAKAAPHANGFACGRPLRSLQHGLVEGATRRGS